VDDWVSLGVDGPQTQLDYLKAAKVVRRYLLTPSPASFCITSTSIADCVSVVFLSPSHFLLISSPAAPRLPAKGLALFVLYQRGKLRLIQETTAK
jgi:hypothetical protein